MDRLIKLHAAFKAGFLGNNLIDTYFSFVANILLEQNILQFDALEIASLLRDRYQVVFPLTFVQQVLGVGVKNGSIVQVGGTNTVEVAELVKYKFDDNDFDRNWQKLLRSFTEFCTKSDVDLSTSDIEAEVLDRIDENDDYIIEDGNISNNGSGMLPIEYAWYKFVIECEVSDPNLYSFITSLTLSNIAKQAIFYSPETTPNYSGLQVYLDSPMVFSVLGMDLPERTQAYCKLIRDMQNANCTVCVFDHNFDEVDGIISRAATIANSTSYDIRKANNAARFFHDNRMTESEITEYCGSLEARLNDLGITVKRTDYDVFASRFQEDEEKLFGMIKSRYETSGVQISTEKERTVRIDVRSIVMVYRERQGHTATSIKSAKHLMITTNNAIANESKKYESNQSLNSGHIPACISADLFGALIWLDSPNELLGYKKKQLLADCYRALKPSPKLLDMYIKSLDDAKREGAIEEKKYLFLRTHPIVLDTLMSITHGDYARFDSSTYLEVYEQIVDQSQQLFRTEKEAHVKTTAKLDAALLENKDLAEKNRLLAEQVNGMEQERRAENTAQLEKKVKRYGWILALLLFGIPYLAIVALTELLKAKFSELSWFSYVSVAFLVVVAIIALVLFNKGKEWCFIIVRKHLLKRM